MTFIERRRLPSGMILTKERKDEDNTQYRLATSEREQSGIGCERIITESEYYALYPLSSPEDSDSKEKSKDRSMAMHQAAFSLSVLMGRFMNDPGRDEDIDIITFGFNTSNGMYKVTVEPDTEDDCVEFVEYDHREEDE